MHTRIVFLLVLLSTAGMHSQNGPAAAAGPARTDISPLSLDVAVFDAHGKAVTTLKPSDFDLQEDGIPQKITSFIPADAPYNVLLLFDCGASTRNRLKLLTDAMSRFANLLRPGDRVEIAVFGSEVHVLLDWSADKDAIIEFGDNPLCKSTDLYGALEWSIQEVRKVEGRRSVVVFTNGLQTDIARQEMQVNGIKLQRIVPAAKDAEFQKILKKVRESGVPFQFVAVDTDLNPGSPNVSPVQDLQQVRARVEQLSEVSGGHIVFPRESSEIVPLFLQIGRDLGSSYSLTYTPQRTRDGNYHTVDVQVRGQNYHLQQSRKGFTAN